MMNNREKKQPQISVNHCAWYRSYVLGIGWQQNEAIVTFRRNRFLGSWRKQRFKMILKRHGLSEYLNVHSLRHTNASLLIANGTDMATANLQSTGHLLYPCLRQAASQALQEGLDI